MTINKIQWYIILTTILYLIISLLGQLIPLDLLSTVYVNELFFIVMGIVLLWLNRKEVYSFVRMDLPSPGAFLVTSAAVFATVFIGGFLTALSMLLTRSLGLPDLPDQALLQATDRSLILVLSFAILPGIAEEFFCRGVLLRSLETVTSRWQAVLYAALVFGLIHFHPWNFLSPAFMGIVFGVLAFHYDSVIIAMYGHALFNLLVLISSKAAQGTPVPELNLQTLAGMIPMTVISLAVLYGFYRRLNMHRSMQQGSGLSLRRYWPSLILVLLFTILTSFYFVR